MKKILTCVIFFVLLILQVSFIYADEVKVKEKYMENTGYYRYYLDDDYYIESSLKLEAVISSVVKITYNDYVTVMLYKDGKPQELSSGDYIFGDGEYTIVIKKDNKVGRINFIFDIVTEEDIDIEENFYNDVELVQSYDSKSGLYRQKMNEEYSLYTSIPNYAITNKNVKVYAKDSKQAYVVVTKDGEEVVFADGKTYSEPGWYCVKIAYDFDELTDSNDDNTMNSKDEQELNNYTENQVEQGLNNAKDEKSQEPIINAVVDVAEFKFYIVKDAQNRLNFINPPKDYEISNIELDGSKISFENKNYFKTTKDGKYTVLFKSSAGFPDYKMEFIRDTKAPSVKFDGINFDGSVEEQVKITDVQNDAHIEVRNDGMPVDLLGNSIDKDGLYVIEVYDDAENKNIYMLNVNIPIKINVLMCAVVVFAVLGAIIIYINYMKNNIKIR